MFGPTIVPLVMDHVRLPVAVVDAVFPVEAAQTELDVVMFGVAGIGLTVTLVEPLVEQLPLLTLIESVIGPVAPAV